MAGFPELSEAEEISLVREKVFPRFQPGESRALIAVLQNIQLHLGYLPRGVLRETADFLGVSLATVWGVATFYNQFRLNPPGRNQIKVCMGTACHIKRGDVILESWERELGIKEGETTPDRAFSLERVACVGCCAMAPVMVVNDEVMGKVSPISVKGVLLAQQNGEEESVPGSDKSREANQ